MKPTRWQTKNRGKLKAPICSFTSLYVKEIGMGMDIVSFLNRPLNFPLTPPATEL